MFELMFVKMNLVRVLNKVVFFSLFLFISCTKRNESVDIKNLGDFNIVNVFNENRYEELKKNNPNLVSCGIIANDNYANYSYLSLRPNRTYTMLLGNQYMFGIYEFINDELILRPDAEKEIKLKVTDVSQNCLQLFGDFKHFKSDFFVEVDNKSSFYINLIPEVSIDKVENDIRSQKLNSWRIKPNKPETNIEIKARLINNLNYIASYMYVNHNSNKNFINISGIKSPFRHAANGIVLNEWKEVDNYWKVIFYDEKDAKVAYELIKYNFIKPYSYPENVGWIELNEILIRQLIKNIEGTDIYED